MKWNKDSIEWAMKAVARHNDVPDYFLDNSADKFIEAYEYFETRYSDKTKEEITLGMRLPEMSHWGMKIKVPNNEHKIVIDTTIANPDTLKTMDWNKIFEDINGKDRLDLRTLYPDTEDLRKAMEQLAKEADVISEAIKTFAEQEEEKRNRQTSFGKINKKDQRVNRRNYLKGKK